MTSCCLINHICSRTGDAQSDCDGRSTVQQNFREWKLKAETEDDKVRRDKRVKELEGELKWFMSEALRLEALSKDYHKEVMTRSPFLPVVAIGVVRLVLGKRV